MHARAARLLLPSTCYRPGPRQSTGRKQAATASMAQRVTVPFSQTKVLLPEGGIEIDGSILEGGGQILRMSAALSVITGRPIRVSNIRANRSSPGLRPQHLAGLQLVAHICQGELQGGTIGSSVVSLAPNRIRPGQHTADPGTAGSCCLLAQAAVPALLFAPSSGDPEVSSTLLLKGGTDADMAPPVAYLQQVLVPTLRRLYDLQIEAKLECRGFYPKGGGSMSMSLAAIPSARCLKAIRLTERGSVTSVSIEAFSAGNLKPSIGKRIATAAQAVLAQALRTAVRISIANAHYDGGTQPAAFGEGAGILIKATTESGCLLGAAVPGQRGVPSEEIGARAATELLEDLQHGGCVDRWLEDQLIIFMALADGESAMTCGEPSLHTRTAMRIAEVLTGAKFTLQPPRTGQKHHTISCQGAGTKPG